MAEYDQLVCQVCHKPFLAASVEPAIRGYTPLCDSCFGPPKSLKITATRSRKTLTPVWVSIGRPELSKSIFRLVSSDG